MNLIAVALSHLRLPWVTSCSALAALAIALQFFKREAEFGFEEKDNVSKPSERVKA
jgi:hypothetical protein